MATVIPAPRSGLLQGLEVGSRLAKNRLSAIHQAKDLALRQEIAQSNILNERSLIASRRINRKLSEAKLAEANLLLAVNESGSSLIKDKAQGNIAQLQARTDYYQSMVKKNNRGDENAKWDDSKARGVLGTRLITAADNMSIPAMVAFRATIKDNLALNEFLPLWDDMISGRLNPEQAAVKLDEMYPGTARSSVIAAAMNTPEGEATRETSQQIIEERKLRRDLPGAALPVTEMRKRIQTALVKAAIEIQRTRQATEAKKESTKRKEVRVEGLRKLTEREAVERVIEDLRDGDPQNLIEGIKNNDPEATRKFTRLVKSHMGRLNESPGRLPGIRSPKRGRQQGLGPVRGGR